MTLPEATRKPCNECPWRRESWNGHLGPYAAPLWVALVLSDEPIACHKTVVEDDDWEEGDVRQCMGAAIFRANIFKRPRNREVVVGEADRELVFASPAEFEEHHSG